MSCGTRTTGWPIQTSRCWGELAAYPWLRAALAAFGEDVRERGPVVDVGCGPGHVTAHLAGLGVDVRGVDLVGHGWWSKRAGCIRPFGSMSRPPPSSPSTTLRSAACWAGRSCSTCPGHVLPDVLASSLPRWRPVVRLLIGTHVGEGDVVRTEAYGGVPVEWTAHRLWQPEQLAALLADAGLELVAELRLPANLFGQPQVAFAARRPG